MRHIYNAFRRRPFRTLFVLAWLAAAPALAAAPCTDATPAPLGSDLKVYELAAGDAALLTVDVPAAGVLLVEVSAPVGADVETRLALFGDDCRPVARDDFRVVTRWISGLVARVAAPGTYRFAVAAQDPGAPLAEVAFTTRFIDTSTVCGHVLLKTHADPEPDPDTLSFCLAKTHADPEPDPDTLRPGNGLLCPHLGDEIHDDVFACATAAVPGEPVTGKLGWEDVDVFTFTVATQRTVEVVAVGDASLHGALYDGSGHRLAVDGDGEGLHLVRTLAPGRYYVRIGGMGDYALAVTTESW